MCGIWTAFRGKAAEQKRRKIDSSVPASTPAQVSYGAVLPQV